MLLDRELHKKIPSRSPECAHKHEPLLPGSHYVSVLDFQEGSWHRLDYCRECWKEMGRSHSAVYWHSCVPQKIHEKKTPDRKALSLWQTLIEKRDHPKWIYVLSLYLARQKLLIYRPQMDQGALRYFEIVESGELYPVQSFFFSQEEESDLTRQLIERLEADE